MRRLFAAVALALFCSVAYAQNYDTEQVILSKYDLDSTDYVYCNMTPDWISGVGRIETDGSNATVTAVTGGTPFTPIAVGDEITVTHPSLTAPVTFTVVARASATSITADRAINLDVAGGVAFQWKDLVCGTTVTDGWVRFPLGVTTVEVIYRQGDLTGGVTFSVQGRNRGSYGVPSQLATGVLATASPSLSTNNTLILGERFSEYRIGVKATTADPSDAGTNIEQIGIVAHTVRW